MLIYVGDLASCSTRLCLLSIWIWKSSYNSKLLHVFLLFAPQRILSLKLSQDAKFEPCFLGRLINNNYLSFVGRARRSDYT